MDTFGSIIAAARKQKRLTQKEIAACIKKQDGQPITAQYHNDIERDRRIPAPYLIGQYAEVLNLDADVLFTAAGALPPDLRRPILQATPETVAHAFHCFRRAIKGKKRGRTSDA
jgi:transcriptional regulator with XRE-family HTH domain